MHPPFFHVDHKVDPAVHPRPARALLRRTRAARLDLSPNPHIFAPTPLRAGPLPPEVFAPGPIRLRVVPPPRQSLRDRIGRFLIRTGQRMIFENHARRV